MGDRPVRATGRRVRRSSAGLWLVAAMLVLAQSGVARAQSVPPMAQPPLPDLAVAPAQLGDARKYWVLHKPGVTAEQAAADLSFCWRFLPRGAQRTLPDFVPWRRATARKKADYSLPQFGLVGVAIGAIIAGPIERSLRQSRLFRCMVPRGYDRYRTSENVWKQLNSDDAAGSIALQARIAASPPPPTPRVER